jgi:hypothetical protein
MYINLMLTGQRTADADNKSIRCKPGKALPAHTRRIELNCQVGKSELKLKIEHSRDQNHSAAK